MFRSLALLVLFSCGGSEESTFTLGSAEGEECDIDINNLAGSTYVMYEAMPDQSYRENPQARVRFEKVDGVLQAKYTVKSLGDVYTYYCEENEKDGVVEVSCREKERVTDWCQALLVHDSDACTKKALRKLGATKSSDEELVKGIKEAKATMKKFRNTEKWNHFVLNNNNLGNKLQGRLWAKKEKTRCRLSIEDMYFTIFNGKSVEDFNPVGKNSFVKSDEEFLFEHCSDGRSLAPHTEAALPKKLSELAPPGSPIALDKPVYYHYVGEEGTKAEEGCTYGYDTFAQWRPLASKIAVEPGDKGKLEWNVEYTWSEDKLVEVGPGVKGGVFHMLRYKTCGGERELIGATCNAAPIR
jgi:predicted RNA-binding protein with PIN domain